MKTKRIAQVLAGTLVTGVLAIGYYHNTEHTPAPQKNVSLSSPVSHSSVPLLKVTAAIDAVGTERTAYYIFQKHGIPGQAVTSSVLFCQTQIYRTLEDLMNKGKISAVFVSPK